MPKTATLKMLSYDLSFLDLASHRIEIEIYVPDPDPQGQSFRLPAWAPGSYLIREFSRHIESVSLYSPQGEVSLVKEDKLTWRGAPCDQPLRLRYSVYGWDLSVRTAQIGIDQIFLSGAGVFMAAVGKTDRACELRVHTLSTQTDAQWRIDCALRRADNEPVDEVWRVYGAPNYDALIDAPLLISKDAQEISFEVLGAPHRLVLTDSPVKLDTARLQHDIAAICNAQIVLFEPRKKRPPFLDSADDYVFLCRVASGAYGGLEHRASCALLTSPSDLPVVDQPAVTEGYRGFLGLVSHEYFHQWWVKRVKPAVFVDYDLSRENYTRLLWVFEGFTAYYDDLMLVRAGVIGLQDYCQSLSKTITQLLRAPGHRQQTLADASFDAWIHYYRPNETTPDTTVSYYVKGALAALCLDMKIRESTADKRSLDDVLRYCWERFGRHFYESPSRAGVEEDEIGPLVFSATGVSIDDWLERYVNGLEALPLDAALARVGLKLVMQAASERPTLDVRVARQGQDVQIATVYRGGAAHQAGLAAFDLLLAIDETRVTAANLDSLLSRYAPGDTVLVHAFRRDRLWSGKLTLAREGATQALVSADAKGDAGVRQRQRRWLHQGRQPAT